MPTTSGLLNTDCSVMPVQVYIVAPLKFQADMGTVLTFMFLVNMVGAVVLLPALGAWLIRPKKAEAAPA